MFQLTLKSYLFLHLKHFIVFKCQFECFVLSCNQLALMFYFGSGMISVVDITNHKQVSALLQRIMFSCLQDILNVSYRQFRFF